MSNTSLITSRSFPSVAQSQWARNWFCDLDCATPIVWPKKSAVPLRPPRFWNGPTHSNSNSRNEHREPCLSISSCPLHRQLLSQSHGGRDIAPGGQRAVPSRERRQQSVRICSSASHQEHGGDRDRHIQPHIQTHERLSQTRGGDGHHGVWEC